MKIRVMSDLHLEWHKDQGAAFIENLTVKDEDVLILAGDITCYSNIASMLKAFCEKFQHVIYVLGNHEYYHAPSRAHVWEEVHAAQEENKNLHWLNNNSVVIDGQWFRGGTMWFRRSVTARSFQIDMSDFHVIKDLEKWVYEENLNFCKFAEQAEREDVWVTHHLPSYQSVNIIYKNNVLNAFFVCDLESLIENFQPKLWIHGHTHHSCDYDIGGTRVLCNPYGYVSYEINKGFNSDKIVEV
jgi:Icc-related predicted phosphoesterase